MVLIPLIERVDAVQQHRQIFPVILGDDIVRVRLFPQHSVPASVGLHIRLIHHVDAVTVAEFIESALVGIMRGPDGVDVAALHGDDVPNELFPVGDTAAQRAEIMPVDAAEDNPLPVQEHQAVLHLKAAEAEGLFQHLSQAAVGIQHLDAQGVQIGDLRAPEGRVPDGKLRLRVAFANRRRSNIHHFPAPVQAEAQAALPFCPGAYVQRAGEEVIRQGRDKAEVPDGGFRQDVKKDAAENAGEAVKILILEPAARGPLVHADSQAVPACPQRPGKRKVRGGEAVLAVAEPDAVEPEGKAAFYPLERDVRLFAKEAFGKGEFGHIIRYRVKNAGHFAGVQFFLGVPGILGVDIGGFVVTLHLDMSRDADAVPGRDVIVLAPEALGRIGGLFRVMKFPDAVQAHAETALPRRELGLIAEGSMVRVCGEPVFGKGRRVPDDRIKAEFCHDVSVSSVW